MEKLKGYEVCKVNEVMYNKLGSILKALEDDIKAEENYQIDRKASIDKQTEERGAEYTDSYYFTYDMEYLNESKYKERAYRDIMEMLQESIERL